MPPKFAQEKAQRERTRDPNVPIQPRVLTAAELPYRLPHAIPPRPTFQQYSKASSATATPPPSTSNYNNMPYHQRLVAAALAAPDDPHSSNDSSSAPSSNALSSSVTSRETSSTSPSDAKGKGKGPTIAPVPSAPRAAPVASSIPVQTNETTEFDPDTSYFECLMENYEDTLPTPGPAYFERRRAIWKTAPPNPPTPSSPSPSRIKLEALLGQPGAVESEEVWRAGLKNVWKGLVGGNQLRKRLPLAIVLKILQAGWLRDGTWPEGMVAPGWDQPTQTPPPPSISPDNSSQVQSQGQGQSQAQQQRRVHEQEAYAAALHARASAEQASGAAQMMHMQAYAMMGMTGGIPPGYSPSSGDAPEEGYYMMPYAYSEPTPPLEGQSDRRSPEQMHESGRDQMEWERRSLGEREEGPPPTPERPGQEIQSEMDTEDEAEDDAEARAESRMEGVVLTGDGRHEGG